MITSSDDGVNFSFEEKVSTSTPGWRYLVSKGLPLPQHPFVHSVVRGQSPVSETYNGLMTERQTRGHCNFVSACKAGALFGNPGCGDLPLPFKLSDAQNELRAKLLSKVRDTKIDLGVALGEYRETAEFVVGAIGKTAKGLRALRRGDASGALSAFTGIKGSKLKETFGFGLPTVAANTTLAINYGLKPLIKDVSDAVTTLQGDLQKRPPVISVRSTLKRQISARSDSMNYHDIVEGDARVSGVISFQVDNPFLYTLEQCGFVNPLLVGWELVPFSFVVDWFLPVGDFLQNVLPPQGVSVVGGSETYCLTGTHTGWTAMSGWNTSMTDFSHEKVRTLYTSFPDVDFVVPDLSSTKSKVANGMALLWQSIRGSRRT